jgi:hypothetical protein
MLYRKRKCLSKNNQPTSPPPGIYEQQCREELKAKPPPRGKSNGTANTCQMDREGVFSAVRKFT